MVGSTVKEMTTNFGKLDKFKGRNFRRWQKKMHFLLTTLKVVYVLTTLLLELLEDAIVKAIKRRARMLNRLKSYGILFNPSTWQRMLRVRSYWILGQYIQYGLKMDESYVSSIIDKLPPYWKDFKHTLKHGKDALCLVQLGSHLRIEESLRTQHNDKGKEEVAGPSVNMTKEGVKNKHNKQNKGKKRGSNENNGGSGSNTKPKLECWKCGKTGHFKRDCRSGNKKNANAGVISEAFYVQVDAIAWWIDSGTTTHVCKDRCWCKTYEPVEDGSVLYMGDDHFALVHGKGSVTLEFSFGKTITLFNVLYVPKLRKNLVSGSMLNKCGYKEVYEFDNSVYMPSSTIVNTSLWHARLGHVHYKRMLEMSKDDLIPAVDENIEKCTTYMLKKITRQPFKSITRKSVILELVHSDLCDFHATPSLDRGGEYYDPVFFQSVGIIHETTTPYTPQQNGVAKRKNRALKKMVNSMLSYSGLSEGFQGDAMAVVRLPDPKRKTLSEKDDVPSEILEPRKGKRVKKAKSYGSDFQLYLEDPRTYNEAMQSRDVAFWKEAIDDEISSMMENNTWVLSDLPPSCKPLGCKWIFKRKMKVDGTIDKFKARLIVVSFSRYSKSNDPSNGCQKNILNSDLNEKVYMKQPEGFVMPGKPVDQLKYSRAIGCLMYAMTSTRPDIAYAVDRLSRFTSNPALAAAGKEADWLRNLIHGIPIWPKPIAPIYIHCDSAATLTKAYSQIYNGKTRHLGVRHSMIRELIMNGVISIEFVRSQHNLADHLTKDLARDIVSEKVEPLLGQGAEPLAGDPKLFQGRILGSATGRKRMFVVMGFPESSPPKDPAH
ncbi:zinc finger, CCHC-type containing protein [Tanacetum coccineum]